MTEHKVIAQVGEGESASDVVIKIDDSKLDNGTLGIDLGNDKIWIELSELERTGLSLETE